MNPSEPLGQPKGAQVDEQALDPGRRFDLRGRTLRQHAARGTLINTGFMVGLSFLAFVKGFILAAFLTTADYGIWGLTAVAVSLIVTLRQVGVVDKFVQQDEENQEVAFQRAFTLELMVSGLVASLIVASLPVFAILYDETRIVVPGLVLAANVVVGAFHIPLWIYYRRMAFFQQRVLQAIDPLVAFVVSVGLAIAGVGYWALVIGVTAGIWAAGLAAVIASPYRLRLRFDRTTLRSYWKFSAPLLLASLGGPVMGQVAYFATQSHLGLAAVGALTLAFTVSQFTDRVDYLVTGSMYPAICAVKDRTSVLFESFVKSNRLALMWAVPFGAGLTLFSLDLVHFVIGERWEIALPLFQSFGIVAALGHLGFNWDAYFRARGETLPLAVAAMAATVTFLLVGIPLLFVWGLWGIAVGSAAQMLVHVALRGHYLHRLFEGFNLLSHALRSFLPVMPATAAVLAARWLEGGERTAAMALTELVTFFGVAAAVTWLLERDLLREAAGYVRGGVAARAVA